MGANKLRWCVVVVAACRHVPAGQCCYGHPHSRNVRIPACNSICIMTRVQAAHEQLGVSGLAMMCDIIIRLHQGSLSLRSLGFFVDARNVASGKGHHNGGTTTSN